MPLDPINLDPARFKDEGYCVFRDAIPSSLLEDCRGSLDASIATLEDGRRMETLVEPHIRAADWRFWLELVRLPRMIGYVEATLGASNLLMLSTHLLVKEPRDGLAVCWHQDNTYWPGVHGTDVVTIWLAIDDADLENSCMKVIPRTHEGCRELEMLPTDGKDLLGVHVEVADAMAEAAVPLELRAGDISVHDSFVIHGSDANHSDRRRAGLTIRYANAETVDVDLDTHRKPVYYVHGDGSGWKDGYRDVSRGKSLPEDPGVHRSTRFDSK